jgi:hypothetical protein
VTALESLGVALGAVGAGLERAQQQTAVADHAAEQIAARAAGSGFTGIAQNMSRVRAAIREIGTGASAVAGRAGEAARVVAATPKQSTPRETAAVLEPVTQHLDGVHGGIAAVMEAIGKAQQLTNAVLQGGQPGPLLARLDAIRTTMLAVAQHINQAKQHTTTALAEARTTGDQGN